MRLRTLVLAISLTTVSCVAAAQRWATIQVPLEKGEAIAAVRFDASRISGADVKRWMEVSEQGRYSAPIPGSYTDCNPSNRQAEVDRLQADVWAARSAPG